MRKDLLGLRDVSAEKIHDILQAAYLKQPMDSF